MDLAHPMPTLIVDTMWLVISWRTPTVASPTPASRSLRIKVGMRLAFVANSQHMTAFDAHRIAENRSAVWPISPLQMASALWETPMRVTHAVMN